MNSSIARSIALDWRFDQLGDYTTQGYLVNSFEAVKPMLDRIKADGFTGVGLQTNVPIDIKMGLVSFYDATSGASNADKHLPVDTWKVVDYAKSIGLNVSMNLNIVDLTNDNAITSQTHWGAGVSIHDVYQGVAAYEQQIATLSQQHHVDAMYVGAGQYGLDGPEYRSDWQNIIDKVRSVYSGKLSYQSDFRNDVVPWSMVDYIALDFNPVLSRTPITNLPDILKKYYWTEDSQPVNTYQAIQSIFNTYQKPIYLSSLQFSAADNAIGNLTNLWDLLMNNQVNLNQPAYYDVQALRIQAFLTYVDQDLSKLVSGLDFFEFSPWVQADWLQDPKINPPWYIVTHLNSEMYNNVTAENVFKNNFLSSNEPVTGSDQDDHLLIYGGNHSVDGRGGVDTAVFLNTYNKSYVTTQAGNLVVQNALNGINTLAHIERVQFTDYGLAFDVDTPNSAGGIFRMYQAAFDRNPMNGDTVGLGYWIAQADKGVTAVKMAEDFTWSQEFLTLFHLAKPTDNYFSGVDSKTIVNGLYQHVLHRAPDAGGLNYYSGVINSHEKTLGRVLAEISDSPENHLAVAGQIANGIQYTPWLS